MRKGERERKRRRRQRQGQKETSLCLRFAKLHRVALVPFVIGENHASNANTGLRQTDSTLVATVGARSRR